MEMPAPRPSGYSREFNIYPVLKDGLFALPWGQNTVKSPVNLCTNFDVHDVKRLQHHKTSQYTWRNNSLKVQFRLDYWMVSKELPALVTNSGIINSRISDHSTITLYLQSKEYVQLGPDFWKINNSLLSDKSKSRVKCLFIVEHALSYHKLVYRHATQTAETKSSYRIFRVRYPSLKQIHSEFSNGKCAFHLLIFTSSRPFSLDRL